MIETTCGLPGNVLQHKLICEYLTNLYARKNADYGDSFHLTFLEEGWAMPRIRLSDKLSRFKTLSRSGDSLVKDESLRDTLIDLANYAIMSVMELDRLTKEAADEKPGSVPENPRPRLHALVRDTDDGGVACGGCGKDLICNEYGDMPDECPGCGALLEYQGVDKRN